LESLVKPSAAFWSGKSVLITGHTGFKGGWLAAWLEQLGARLSGFALAPDTEPNLFTQLGLDCKFGADFHDIRDKSEVDRALAASDPEIIFHLAAQPLVRLSYRDPLGTLATNVMGTANLLHAAQSCARLKAVIVVTTDKCYENHEWVWPYRESDPLGGRDPYSASKACTEIVARSFRDSFLAERGVQLATARAGNVVGGGDWAADRLVPDCVRAALKGETVVIRNPAATRPWQHVLEPLLGYILLAERLYAGAFANFEAFNFGPPAHSVRPVSTVASCVMELLGGKAEPEVQNAKLHEATNLNLDSSKARARLGWRPRLGPDETLEWTAAWYRAVMQGTSSAPALTLAQIEKYQSMDRAV
jgi:CDP-glucose 4,6-dehydratase